MQPLGFHLEGAPNFRDLGGYRTVDGRTVRRNRLFRSEAFHRLTDRDLETLRKLDIRLVCDLRGHRERRYAPSRWPSGHSIEEIHINIDHDLRAANESLYRLLEEHPGAGGARLVLQETYREMPDAFAGRIGSLFERMLDGGLLPAVIHCSAGKDRTGFISAILLLALNVPLATVYEDYLLSAKFFKSEEQRHSIARLLPKDPEGRPPDPAVIDALAGVHPENLTLALETARSIYGSLDDYLEKGFGLDIARRKRLCELLLV